MRPTPRLDLRVTGPASNYAEHRLNAIHAKRRNDDGGGTPPGDRWAGIAIDSRGAERCDGESRIDLAPLGYRQIRFGCSPLVVVTWGPTKAEQTASVGRTGAL